MIKRLAACIGLLLLLWGTSCSHRYARTDTAHRTEEARSTWQTEETAESRTQSVATEKKQGSRLTRRWAPDGKLLEEVSEQWGSDGRVQVSASGSASRSASGADFSSVVARSSSVRVADTKAGWPSPLWLLLLVPLAVGGWALKRWGLPRIPWL